MIARVIVYMVLSLFLASCTTTDSSTQAFLPMPGDLLFQDIDCGPLCDAIETVTQGVDGARFSHVGMVTADDAGTFCVIEAVSAGVVETPLDEFLARSLDAQDNPKVLVGRLKPAYRHLIPQAIAYARGKLGLPYDHIFAMEDDAYYCSELLYDSFRAANGAPIFDLCPMTFQDPATDETFAPWAAYCADLGVSIPEGEPGLNPGGMSMSPTLDIIHAYGIPDGWLGMREQQNLPPPSFEHCTENGVSETNRRICHVETQCLVQCDRSLFGRGRPTGVTTVHRGSNYSGGLDGRMVCRGGTLVRQHQLSGPGTSDHP